MEKQNLLIELNKSFIFLRVKDNIIVAADPSV